jgi:hypothetical protein
VAALFSPRLFQILKLFGDLRQLANAYTRPHADAARTRVMMAENLESSLLNKPRSGTKRPFREGSAASQAHDRQDLTLKHEDRLISSLNTNEVPFAPPENGDVRRYAEEVMDNDFHIEKRSRTSDWPLRSANTTGNETPSITRVALRDRYNTLNSASPPCRTSMKPRSSKFVEGSMSDRASQQPHSSYIGDSEQPREQFEAEQNFNSDTRTNTQFNGLAHHTDRSVTLSVAYDKPDVSRPSSIFRFGKSVAAAFNPSSWKIWSKQQEEDTREKRILRERHEKAEKIYKELKRTGQLRGCTYENHYNTQDKSIPFNKHDSGVDLEHGSSRIDTTHRIGSRMAESRIEEKRYGRIFLDPPSTGTVPRSESPASELSVPFRNSSSQNREPTLKTGEISNGPQALRRLPSRKDLQKQQKLVKRVSDLEGKLEAARRQLAEALGEPIPAQAARISRSRFTPSTLASLPSERLLSVYTAPEPNFGDADTEIEVGRAISIDNRTSPLVPNDRAEKLVTKYLINPSPQRSDTLALENALAGSNAADDRRDVQKVDVQMAEDGQMEQAIGDTDQGISDNLASRRQTTKKRKTVGMGAADNAGTYKPTLDADDDDGSEAPKPSIPKRGPGRPRKLRKVEPEPKSLRPDPIETKHAVSRAIMEINSPISSHTRTIKSPRDHRAVLIKKVASPANSSRIPRKGRYSTSPSPPMSSSGITYTGQEVSTGKTAELDSDEGVAISTVPSASVEVPPIPEIPGISGPRKAVSASTGTTGSRAQINPYDNADWGQKRSRTTHTDIKTGRSNSKQAFEWPADVF